MEINISDFKLCLFSLKKIKIKDFLEIEVSKNGGFI